MNQPRHTPGPWRAVRGKLVRVFAHGAISPVCGVHRLGKFLEKENPLEVEANADLIAAAPEMLEALKKTDLFLHHLKNSFSEGVCEHTQAMIDANKAAIAKAEGRT